MSANACSSANSRQARESASSIKGATFYANGDCLDDIAYDEFMAEGIEPTAAWDVCAQHSNLMLMHMLTCVLIATGTHKPRAPPFTPR